MSVNVMKRVIKKVKRRLPAPIPTGSDDDNRPGPSGYIPPTVIDTSSKIPSTTADPTTTSFKKKKTRRRPKESDQVAGGGDDDGGDKKYKFTGRNRFMPFYKATIEEANDVIEAYSATLDSFNFPEISALRQIRTKLPWILLLDFFKTLDPNYSVVVAYKKFKERPDVQDALLKMDQLLTARAVPVGSTSGVSYSSSSSSKNLSEIIAHIKTRYPPTKIIAKRLKYDRKLLEKMSLEELTELAADELPLYKVRNKKGAIDALVNIEEIIDPATYRRFETELLPVCESDYKRAPWMKTFETIPVAGIAVKKESIYATEINVKDDWYKATAGFYRDACEKGRQFQPDSVAYVFRNGSIIIETIQMYEEMLSFFKPKNPSINYNINYDNNYCSSSSSCSSGPQLLPTPPPPPPPPQEQKEDEELAPGLFNHVRSIISGNYLFCDTCHLSITQPMFKSVHNNKRVLFCSKDCFEKYSFNKS